MCEDMCIFLPLDRPFWGQAPCLASPTSSPMSSYSINLHWIMNENERTLYLVKANYVSIPFPFFISNLGSKFTSKYFKCCCVGCKGSSKFLWCTNTPWCKYICLSLWSIFLESYFLRFFFFLNNLQLWQLLSWNRIVHDSENSKLDFWSFFFLF